MKLEKAEKYLEILNNYKGEIKSEKGLPIYKFEILPVEYLNKNNIIIDLNKIVDKKNDYQLLRNKEWDYKILGIIRPLYSVVALDWNSEYYEKLIESKEIY